MDLPEIAAWSTCGLINMRNLRAAVVKHVQVFENRGAMMGASNPHPHGQIWIDETVPLEPAKEILRCGEHLHKSGRCLLCDYLAFEHQAATRAVCANDHFVVVVPFWAVWPFETLLLSRRHVNTITDPNSTNGMAWPTSYAC
jgi:UDPglucose--hexose-1-phosphate uridylyltransferase